MSTSLSSFAGIKRLLTAEYDPKPTRARQAIRAGDSQAGQGQVGLYHIAWEVDTLDELERIAQVLSRAGSLVGASDHGTTKALYARDPDGLEFEVCWLVPADHLPVDTGPITRPLDLDAEITRYGGSTRGGVGVSIPSPA